MALKPGPRDRRAPRAPGESVPSRIRRRLGAAAADESAATAIEYGLIAAGIGLAVAAVVFAFGNNIEAYYQAIDDRITERTLT